MRAGQLPRSRAGNAPQIDIAVEAGDWPSAAALRRLAATAVAAAARGARLKLAKGAELSLVFTDDAHVRLLNLRYRGKDTATNVLSFPGPPHTANIFGPMLGDIVFAAETVAAEAAGEGLTLSDHLAHLLVHGFLHLVSYDHSTDAEAAAMEALETTILAELGIADPYAATVSLRH